MVSRVLRTFVVVFSLALTAAAPAGAERITLEFDPAGLRWIAAEGGFRAELAGAPRDGTPGLLDLPAVPVPVAPPGGRRLEGLRVVSLERVPVVPPGLVVRYRGDLAASAPQPEVVIPGGGGYLRGQRLDGLVVRPLRRDGNGGWSLAVRIEVELRFAPDGAEDVVRPRRGPVGFEFASPPPGLVHPSGGESVRPPRPPRDTAAEAGEPFAPTQRPSDDGSPVPYVIVTSELLEGAFEPLAAWRTRTGLPAVIRTVEWIEENYPRGTDVPERIREFIRDAVTHWGTEYVLLGADHPAIPVRYGRTSFFGGELIPADLYYQCLDGNWNGNGNALFGEGRRSELDPGDEADLLPDVWLGRIPVSSPEQAAVMVEKILRYEQDPPITPTYPAAALMLAEVLFPAEWGPGTDPLFDGAELAEQTVARLPDGFAVDRLYENWTAFEDASVETLTTAIAALDTGYGIVHHVGHGSFDNLKVGRAESEIKIFDADRLANGPRSSVLYAINCTSASVDRDCIAEHFLYNAGGGMVAIVGSTRFDFPGTSTVYDLEYYRLVFRAGTDRLGEAAALAKVPFVPNSLSDNAHRWTQFTLICLGDPAMRIWTGVPVPLEVAHVERIPAGSADLAVTVTSGGVPVEGASVVVHRSGDVFAAGITDADGGAVIPIAPREEGMLDLTASARNHRPALSDGIEVGAPEGPLPVLVASDLDDGVDSPGNGRLESGEEASLSFTLGNGGTEGLTGLEVVARLHPEDALAATIAPAGDGPDALGAGSDGTWPFTIVAATDLGAVRTLRVELAVSADQGSWTVPAAVQAAQPRLDLAGLEPVEELGNGDGIPDAGETWTLRPRIVNLGHGAALDLVASLQVREGSATVVDGEVLLGALPGGSALDAPQVFRVQLDDDDPLPLFTLDVQDRLPRAGGAPVEVLRLTRPVDLVAPAAPQGLAAGSGSGSVVLTWTPVGAADLHAYEVETASAPEGPFTPLLGPGTPPGSRFVHGPLTTLAPRHYRVAARDASGNRSPWSETVRGVPQAFPATGFPLPARIGTVTSPLAADLEGDGVVEVVVGGSAVYAFHGDASEVLDGDDDPSTRGVFAEVADPLGVWAAPAAGDVDGDGRLEVAAVSRQEGRVYLWDADGNLRPGFPAGQPAASDAVAFAAPVLADVTGDGFLEIVAMIDRQLRAFDRHGNELRDGDGDPSTDGVFRVVDSRFSYGSPAVVDVDGDAREEILLPTRAGTMYLIDDDGSDLPGWPIRFGDYITSSPAVADLDGDGSPEFVFGTGADSLEVRRVDGTPLPGWPVSVLMNQDILPSPAVGDVDGDGDLEIAVVSANTTVSLWHHDGIPFDGFPIRFYDDQQNSVASRSAMTLANLDDDADLELVFTNQRGAVYGLNPDGTPVDGFPVQLTREVEGGALVADLDGDGSHELAVSGLDALHHVFRTDGVPSSRAGWPMFRHDPRRTGRLDTPLDDRDRPRLLLSAPADLRAEAGSELEVPIGLLGNTAVGELAFVLEYDGEVLEALAVIAGPLAGNLDLAADLDIPGRAGVLLRAPAGSPLEAPSGELVRVRFAVSGGTGSPLRIVEARAEGPGGNALPAGGEAVSLTAVRGVAFSADIVGGGVRLAWTAEADDGHLGFRVFRDAGEGFRPLHDGLLPAGAREFTDARVEPGQRLRYELEALDRSGAVQRFGPVRVVVPAPGPWLGAPVPNPARGPVRVEVRGIAAGGAASVIDAAGRRVRVLALPPGDAGEIVWDGRTDGGADAPAGIYFLHVRAGGDALTRRIVKLAP